MTVMLPRRPSDSPALVIRSGSSTSLDSLDSTMPTSETITITAPTTPCHRHSHSDACTAMEVASSTIKKGSSPARRTKKRVRFAPRSELIDNDKDEHGANNEDEDVTFLDHHHRWYSSRELPLLKYGTRKAATRALMNEPAWAELAVRAYLQFHANTSIQNVEQMDKLTACATPIPVHANTVGLENVLPALVANRRLRRTQMYTRVAQLQQSASGKNLADRIRMACTALSRPSRLYAHYVAKCAVVIAERGDDRQDADGDDGTCFSSSSSSSLSLS